MRIHLLVVGALLTQGALISQEVDDRCWRAWRDYERELSTLEGYKAQVDEELTDIATWSEMKDAASKAAMSEFKASLKDAKGVVKACAKAATSVNPVSKGVNIVKASVGMTKILARMGAILVNRSGVDLRVHAYKRLQHLADLIKKQEALVNDAYNKYRACCDALPPSTPADPKPPIPPGEGVTTNPSGGGGGGRGTGDPKPADGETRSGETRSGGSSTGGTSIHKRWSGDGIEVFAASAASLRVTSRCGQDELTQVFSRTEDGVWRARYRGYGNAATIGRKAGETLDLRILCTPKGGETREYPHLTISGR